jgi:hypothetical protein
MYSYHDREDQPMNLTPDQVRALNNKEFLKWFKYYLKETKGQMTVGAMEEIERRLNPSSDLVNELAKELAICTEEGMLAIQRAVTRVL